MKVLNTTTANLKPMMARAPDPVPPAPRWQCCFCDQPAVLMHKGSTYCRADYDEKGRAGKLIS